MKTLVVYYSRTGITKQIAEEIACGLHADIEEIPDVKPRTGLFGWLRSGREAAMKLLPEIGTIHIHPKKYDLVILGTPVWAGTMASPMRTYITDFCKHLKNVAFFCTLSGSIGKTFDEMHDIIKKPAFAQLAIRTKDVKKKLFKKKVLKFVHSLEHENHNA